MDGLSADGEHGRTETRSDLFETRNYDSLILRMAVNRGRAGTRTEPTEPNRRKLGNRKLGMTPFLKKRWRREKKRFVFKEIGCVLVKKRSHVTYFSCGKKDPATKKKEKWSKKGACDKIKESSDCRGKPTPPGAGLSQNAWVSIEGWFSQGPVLKQGPVYRKKGPV